MAAAAAMSPIGGGGLSDRRRPIGGREGGSDPTANGRAEGGSGKRREERERERRSGVALWKQIGRIFGTEF